MGIYNRLLRTISVLVITPFIGFSQVSLVDSLIQLTKQTTINDSVKIKLYGDISWELMGSDINLALDYATKELDLSVKARRKADIAQSESDIGNIYNRKAVYDTALIHYHKALGLRQELKQDEKVAGVYSNIAAVYIRQNKFKEALEINFKSLKLFETLKNAGKQAILLGNIGFIYYELEQNKLAESFYRKGLGLAREGGLPLVESNLLVELGGIMFETAVVKDSLVDPLSLDSALNYFLAAEKIMAKNNALYNLGVVYNNIGRIYIHKNDYKKASAFYLLSLKNREALEDKLGIGLSFLNLGEVCLLTKDYNTAGAYFGKSADIFLSLRSLVNLKQAYGKMAMVYEAKNDLLKALKFHQLYAQYKDSVYSEENAKQMAEMQTRYDVEKKDLELAKSSAELLARSKEAEIKNTIIVSIVLLMILVIVILVIFYRQKQLKQQAKMNAELAAQKDIRAKAIIEAEEKERIRIAKDLHDGVGQLLSAAKMNLSSMQDKLQINNHAEQVAFNNALDLVDESVKEVRAVSHNMMPNTLLKMGLASAVKEFITKIQSTPNLKVNLEIVGLSERIEQEKESVLYRVIQEVVSNIIRHARASELSMQLIRHDNELNIFIEDNGIGFNAVNINAFDGIGLKNILSRIEFINGTVHFDSTPGKGTRVIIDVPIVATGS